MICAHYALQSSGLTQVEAMGQNVVIWDIKGPGSITVEFPWRSETEWKKVNNGVAEFAGNYQMGEFSLRVLNNLQAVETVSTTVDINIYVSAGKDYELSGLSNNAIDFIPVAGELVPSSKGRRRQVVEEKHFEIVESAKARPARMKPPNKGCK